jgi:hypothetical protein
MPGPGQRLSVWQSSIPAALAAWLEGRSRVVAGLVLLGVLLAAPSLVTGLVADDRLHALLLRSQPGIAGLSPHSLDLFHFAKGDAAVAERLMNHGVFPWWTDRHVVLAFLRPLAAATHWLDHRLWPERPLLMHLQSLLWLGLLLALAARVYLRFAPTRAAALLALLLLVVDDAHAPAVGWIANRSLLIALVFTLLSLLAHDRSRRRQGEGSWLGPTLLAAGLLAGEAALSGVAYLVSYALFLDERPLRSRLSSLLGYGLVIVVWRMAYQQLGYGAAGSGVYIDPASEPLAFARAALTRLPVLFLSSFALPWSDLWDVFPLFATELRPIVLGLALATGATLAVLLRPLLQSSRSARFWAAGCGLSLLPCAATFPHDRLLLGTTIGTMGLLSELFLGAGSPKRRVEGVALASFGIVHLFLAPVLLPFRSATVAHLDALLWRADETISRSAALSRQTLVLMNPPVAPFGSYFPIYREAAHLPRPDRFLWLATGVSELQIRCLDSRTLSIRPSLGYLSDSSQLMLRSLSRPFHLGEKVILDEAAFEIVELTADGRPAQVLVRFVRELGDPRLVFMRWGTHGYVPFRVPPPGQSVVLPRVDLIAALSG